MSTEIKPRDDFGKAIWLSFTAHLFLVLFFQIKTFLGDTKDLQFETAMRVDIVALPEKIQSPPSLEETPNNPVLPEKKQEPKEPETIKLANKKDLQKEALNKLKAQQAIAELKNKKLDAAKKNAASLVKGNQISAGTELTGVSRLQYDRYVAALERHVRERWALPEWLRKRPFRAVVLARIDEQGNIIGLELSFSSGNKQFDDLALETVQNSAPLPAPSEKFVAKLKYDGVSFGFPD
jgi:TonB family protein